MRFNKWETVLHRDDVPPWPTRAVGRGWAQDWPTSGTNVLCFVLSCGRAMLPLLLPAVP